LIKVKQFPKLVYIQNLLPSLAKYIKISISLLKLSQNSQISNASSNIQLSGWASCI